MGIHELNGTHGTELAGEPTFLYEKGNENLELGTIYFVHNRIRSAVRRTEHVSDRILHIILTDHWCDIIVLNVYASTEDKIDDMKDSFYARYATNYMKTITKNLFGDFNAKVVRKDNFQTDNWEREFT
jgi:hypothetical protein